MIRKKFILLIFLIFGFMPANAFEDSILIPFEDYVMQDEIINESRPFEVKASIPSVASLEDEFKLDNESIGISADIIKLQISKTKILSDKELLKDENARASLFKTEKFNLFSDSTKELSDYMTNNVKTTLNASYVFNDKFSIQTGHETWYVNPDASLGSRKFYFNPHVNLSDKCYFDYVSKYNQTTKNIEQEVGVNYKPKIFKDAASFGVKATTVINEDNQVQSKRLKFSTDFYLF